MITHFIQRFDPRRNFQYVNDEPSVLHCHHYASLFTRLALDHKELNAPEALADSMEESIYLVLKKYFIAHKISTRDEKKQIGEEYFSLIGMGSLRLNFEENSAEMVKSHVDEGWIKKWGKTDQSVNYMGCGYIASVFSLINDKKVGSYNVKETASLVKGQSVSRFTIAKKEA